MQISNQTAQALRQLDQNQNGVTAKELKKLDKDNDGVLSKDEAKEAGLDLKDLDGINQKLSDAAKMDPSEVLFSKDKIKEDATEDTQIEQTASETNRDSNLTGTKKKKQKYSDTWTSYRDAGNDPSTVKNIEDLRKTLGISDKWSSAGKLKELLDLMKAEGLDTPQNLTYLAKLKGRHSLGTLNAVSRTLINYYKSGTAQTGVSKKEVLSGALHDIAIPSNINQASCGTCGATAIQMKLAIERPSQYVKMLTTLAQGKNYKTPGGDTVNPNNTWKGDTSDRRMLTSKIMQNAIMNLARGDTSYNSANNDQKGTSNAGERKAIQSLYGDDVEYDLDQVSDWTNDADDLFQYLEDDLARGRAVSVSFKGHSVTVVGLDKTVSPPKIILDSWSGQHTMTVDDFKKHIVAVRSQDDSGSDNHKTPANSKTIVGDK